MSKALYVTDAEFEEVVINADKPVLVDFWAEWCGPCKMIAPLIDQMADDYDGRLIVTKLNVDDNQETASRYGIRSIPTLLIFQNGQVHATKMGALSKSQLTAFIDANI